MDTRLHTASNLYKYIENARQMENLELQIKQKEKDIKAHEELQNIYTHATKHVGTACA